MIDVPANAASLGFVEELYESYLRDPDSVPESWRAYFSRVIQQHDGQARQFRTAPRFRPASVFDPGRPSPDGAEHPAEIRDGQIRTRQHHVDQIIRNFRVRGHIAAALDPLGTRQPMPPELDPAFFGLDDADLDLPFSVDEGTGPPVQTLRQILERMRNTYCRHIGAQFMHIDDVRVRQWLQQRMESTENRVRLSRPEQLRILKRLTDAVVFEQFLQRKYVGAKTFSLEGAETLIPLLDLAIDKASTQGVDEIVLAMSHRGRLNVLANIIGKSPRAIFREFEDRDPQLYMGGGDVKYHLGYSSDWYTSDGRKVHLSLCFNPSHLEFINPVALGRVRAKQDRAGDVARERGMALLIHGDAAFAGEGVVQETLNLCRLAPYTVGGALHVIVNNQLGFTTTPQEYRSTVYATDVAKMLQAPIFHVNGEEPEAVAQVVQLAMDFRHTFHTDVFIDMYCYRLRGHNEGDEPSFTQPIMYDTIERRKGVRESYLEHLLKLGGVTEHEAEAMAARTTRALEEALEDVRRDTQPGRHEPFRGIWAGYLGGPDDGVDPPTGVPRETLSELLEAATRLPHDFHPHPKVRRLLSQRRDMARGKRPLDWAAAELLAFASLAQEGYRVRLTGQDSERGTFSQRHAVLHDVENGQTYCPLRHLSPEQASIDICNSPLSETSVLGFEYGYSLDTPDGLVMWEAQFGDFANAGQVIIDQFITSAEDKWRRLSGLVLLLPHGFEGQGPEHASARIERFLTLAAEDNIQVVYPTTPVQYFHVLRRQMVRKLRKPLVVFTPKSLLRRADAVSTLDELATGAFRRVIPDSAKGNAIHRVLLCTGKIYYELAERRTKLKRQDVAIVRLEQLYPLPAQPLRDALAGYRDGTQVVFVQEEPDNMGAWPFLYGRLGRTLFDRFPLSAVTRAESASPATGSPKAHRLEQEQLLEQAFAA